jgi:pyruvate dehydrogenase E2 component (dihydrolipoamide acetyltransferase)
MVKRANEGKLQSNDIQGGTFTITNLGMYGIDVFNAVINPPEATILSVGRIVDRVVPIDSQPIVQPMMLLSLSCDHRVVDGARGAEFLQTMAGLIEEPLALLN